MVADKAPRLVTVTRDYTTDTWRVTCAVCGRLAALRRYWPAAYMAMEHEPIHEDEEASPAEPLAGPPQPGYN